MQKYRLNDGTPLIGQAALLDTMKDLITDSAGALAASVFGFVSLKKEKGWLSHYSIDRAYRNGA